MDSHYDLVKIFGAVLDLCKVQGGETLAALTQGGERGDYASAYLAAAQDRGAFAFQINLPKLLPQPGAKTRRRR
jgi:2,5-dihydroxypyridine 5,6-dioxygenase